MSDEILDITHVELTSEHLAVVDAIKHIAPSKTVILHSGGKEVAALISIEDLHLLERLIEEEEDRIDVAEAKQILAQAKEQGTIPLAQVKAKLGL